MDAEQKRYLLELVAEARQTTYFCSKCGQMFSRPVSDATAMHDELNGCRYLAHRLPTTPLVERLANAVETLVAERYERPPEPAD